MSLLPFDTSTMPSSTVVKPKGTSSVLGKLSLAGQALGFVSNLVGTETIKKTIGQALRDGFDCWGSSWTPTRAKEELPMWMGLIGEDFKLSLNVEPDDLQNSVNAFFENVYGLYITSSRPLGYWIHWAHTTSKDCTKRGLVELEKGIDAYMGEVVTTLKKVCLELGYGVSVGRSKTIKLKRSGQKDYSYRVYSCSISIPDEVEQVDGGTTKKIADHTSNAGFGILGWALVALFLGRKFVKK